MTEITPNDGIAIVTGAGSGLGRALSITLTQRGFTVAGTGRRIQALTDTASLCADGLFLPRPVDVSKAEDVSIAVSELVRDVGPIAILINNAAVYPRRDFLDETPFSFSQTMDINLGGVLNCSLAVLSHMAQHGQGRILNVATYADIAPLPASSAYSVSKGAARILSRAMIADLADRFPNIVISDWMPGMLQTTMGIPDGLSPDVSANWGARLACMRDPSLTGSVFEMNQEILPPRGIKGKIKDLILLQRRKPRIL